MNYIEVENESIVSYLTVRGAYFGLHLGNILDKYNYPICRSFRNSLTN